jgi:hypothetical protein
MTLDQEIQLRDIDDLVGHTIKAVIEHPMGKRDVDIVLVTETGCWLALKAEGGSFDEAPTIETEPYYGGTDIPLSDYLSAGDALRHGLINQATYEVLKEKEREEEEAAKKAKADRLRRQLAELEGGTP